MRINTARFSIESAFAGLERNRKIHDKEHNKRKKKKYPPSGKWRSKSGRHGRLRRALFLYSRKDSLHLCFFALHVGVDIPFQGHIRVSVAQNFAQSFDVAAALQAGGCKGMPQGVRVHPAHPGPAQIASDALVVAARFHRPLSVAREKPGVRAGAAPQFA